jgi:tetratricopeptide (TPR) repeat protein
MRLVRNALLSLVLTVAVVGPACAAPSPPAEPANGIAAPAPDAAMDAARALVADGRSKDAIASLVPYTHANPRDLAAGRLLGDLYFRVPDYNHAQEAWERVLAAAPGDMETHNRLGALYAAEDRPEEAILEFQQSLPLRSAYEGMVAAHQRIGDLPAYLAKLEYTLEKYPFYPKTWRELGAARRALHEPAAALEAYRHVVGLEPNSCDARVDLANTLVDLGNVDEAIVQLHSCALPEAHSYAAVVNTGEAYLEKGDSGTARTYLDRALAMLPTGSEALVDIGYIYDLKGDWKTSLSYYARAMNADPLRPEPYIDLGFAYEQHELYPLAEAAYLKGISVADSGRLHFLLGKSYEKQGKLALARAEFTHALGSDEAAIANASRRELAEMPLPAR